MCAAGIGCFTSEHLLPGALKLSEADGPILADRGV